MKRFSVQNFSLLFNRSMKPGLIYVERIRRNRFDVQLDKLTFYFAKLSVLIDEYSQKDLSRNSKISNSFDCPTCCSIMSSDV